MFQLLSTWTPDLIWLKLLDFPTEERGSIVMDLGRCGKRDWMRGRPPGADAKRIPHRPARGGERVRRAAIVFYWQRRAKRHPGCICSIAFRLFAFAEVVGTLTIRKLSSKRAGAPGEAIFRHIPTV